MATNNANPHRRIRQLINDGLQGASAKCIRICLARTPASPRAMTRAYFRGLRAAEMAFWEMTGGDYMGAGFAT